ncbi:PQ loop repeat-domain-containing protein [Lipomyces arxii]|uniref:PQ loop repeat-domain-containing protein n=1 Tax=Lipomyces arxii TaxID=56418 RepID=UPI0034CEFA89
MSKEALSVLSGSISIACWAMVFSPQLYDIFRRQNADNLSVVFLWLWFLGDMANITGCILQETLPTMTILAVYNTLTDLVMIFQAAYYRRTRLRKLFSAYAFNSSDGEDDETTEDKEEVEYFQSLVVPPRRIWKSTFFKFGIVFMIVLSSLIGLYCATNGHLYNAPMKYYNPNIPLHLLGQLCGWFCASVYVISRVPQIVLNYKQKSCHSASLIYVLFASGGNFTFIVSILALDNSWHYLFVNSSWLWGTFCSLTLDYVIVLQLWHYDPNRVKSVKTDKDGKEVKKSQ